jgi:hypothetical protein
LRVFGVVGPGAAGEFTSEPSTSSDRGVGAKSTVAAAVAVTVGRGDPPDAGVSTEEVPVNNVAT